MSNPESPTWDVIVIGAGAAGLLAAYRASSRGLKTLLLEKNHKIGVKILMSGGTRCNITHNTDASGIVSAFGRQGSFLHSALASLSPDQLIALMNEQGVATKVESTGKIFPVSDRAVDVRDALVRLLRHDNPNCEIATGAAVTDVAKTTGGFCVATSNADRNARNLIVTTGGKSYPGCGTCGDGYAWAERFGHTIVTPVPSLAPIVVGDQWPRELKGVTLDDVQLTVTHGDKKIVEQTRDSFLFTHFGFSGPAPMNVSRAFHRFPASELKLRCDFWPAENLDRLREATYAIRDQNASKAIAAVFRPELSRRFVEQLLGLADIDPKRKCGEVSRKGLNRAVQLLKRLEFKIQGTRGFKKAEVTAGGVALPEVDSSTMQSKKQTGLYFAGEILDLDGPIGGYNFQAAFSTGWLAGSKVGVSSQSTTELD